MVSSVDPFPLLHRRLNCKLLIQVLVFLRSVLHELYPFVFLQKNRNFYIKCVIRM